MIKKKTIVVIATLDNKGPETKYLKERIESRGGNSIVIDTSTAGEPYFVADITREQVAEASGTNLAQVLAIRDAGEAQLMIRPGTITIVKDLYSAGRLDGIICLGGGMGSALGITVMRELPIGVPKILVTTVPRGKFVGTTDVTTMPTVTDLAGLNRITMRVLANAAAAIVAMAEASEEKILEKPIVVMSMLGSTSRCAMQVKSALEDKYEVMIFHTTGPGGRALEDLVRTATSIVSVIELGLGEIASHMLGGISMAGPDRLQAAGERGIPQIITLGNVDFIVFGEIGGVPSKYKRRRLHSHNPYVTLMRLNVAESRKLGRIIARKLNKAIGQVHVVIPTRGFSQFDAEDGIWYDPETDKALIATLKSTLNKSIVVKEIDANINDPGFAEVIMKDFFEMIEKGKR